MPYNTPPTFSDGDPWSANEANLYVRDNFAHLTKKIGARVRKTTNHNATNATNAPEVSYDTEVEDTDAFFTGSQPTLFQVPAGLQGMYAVYFYVNWTVAPDVNNVAIIRKNGNAMVRQTAPATQFASVCLVYIDYLNSGDQVSTALYTAVNKTITPLSPTGNPPNDPGSPEFWIRKI